MSRHNPALYKLLLQELSTEKRAFVPAQDPAAGGAPMDPAMMGAPPMDPAMAGGAPPMDPAMMGGDPMAGMPPELMEQLAGGMAPDGLPMEGVGGEEPGPGSDEVKDKIKEVLEETGVIKPKKMKPDEQFHYLTTMMEKIMDNLGIEKPEEPVSAEESAANAAVDQAGIGSASSMDIGSMGAVPVGEVKTADWTKPGGSAMANRLRAAMQRSGK